MRRLRLTGIALLAVSLAGVAVAGASYLTPARRKSASPARMPKPSSFVPGYGGPVSDQSSGRLETPVAPGPASTVSELEAAGAQPSTPQRVRGSFIVALAPGQNPDKVAADIARDYGGDAKLVYDNVIGGFQFVGPDDAGTRLAHDPRVRSVQPDYEAHLAESSAAVHLAAINATSSISAGNNGHGVRIGILDTGADLTHPDLAGQVASDSTGSCVGASYQDQNGHGTRTTSNAVGLDGLGVAPGAKAVVVRVFAGSGTSTTFATIACGV